MECRLFGMTVPGFDSVTTPRLVEVIVEYLKKNDYTPLIMHTGNKIAEEIISAVAVSTSGAPNRTVEINNGKISFNAGLDDWKILLVKSDFRTAVTRAVNNPNGGKDATNSLCDYLNPVAVQQFIDWTHKQYKKYLGKELGTTVLGFRGDEPDYAHLPSTDSHLQTFKDTKAYDPTPYLASFFTASSRFQYQRV